MKINKFKNRSKLKIENLYFSVLVSLSSPDLLRHWFHLPQLSHVLKVVVLNVKEV